MLSFVEAGSRRAVASGAVALCVVALCVLAGAALPAAAAEVTANPSADTFVFAAEPGSNYGGAGAIEVSGANTVNGEFQGLLKFNLAAARSALDAQFGAGGWKLDAATLRLTASNPNNPLFNANAAGPISVSWMQNDSWVEGTGGPVSPSTDGVTYTTLPTFLGPADEPVGTINFAGGNSGATLTALSLSPGFVSDVLSGSDASLRLAPGSGTVSYLFSSRSFGTAANRPVLTLTASAVPEPSAGIALLGAMGLLLGRRGRRS